MDVRLFTGAIDPARLESDADVLLIPACDPGGPNGAGPSKEGRLPSEESETCHQPFTLERLLLDDKNRPSLQVPYIVALDEFVPPPMCKPLK